MTLEIHTIDRTGLRSFGLMTGVIVGVLFGLLLPWLFEHTLPLWPWYITAGLAGWAIIHPDSLRIPYRMWMKFGHVLGWINTRIILGLLFVAIILPVALVLKLLGKDAMRRMWDNDAGTYRNESTVPPERHMERPY